MAEDEKISALAAKTTVHDNDLFTLVDTEASPDETKKITGANMKTQMTSAHAALTTGVHGVGASTVASMDDIPEAVEIGDLDEKATPTSSDLIMIEDVAVSPTEAKKVEIGNLPFLGRTECRAYLGDADQENMPSTKYARVELDSVNYDVGSNFKTGYVFNQEQADANNCTSTNIRDTSVNFQTVTGKTDGLRYALVKWSSDAGGTANVGSGYVQTVVNANNLTIYKTSGADFANSYYYTIKEAWYQVPRTGIYLVSRCIQFTSTNLVADKLYYSAVAISGVLKSVLSFHAASIATTYAPCADYMQCTEGDLISLVAFHTAGVDTCVVGNHAAGNVTWLTIALVQGYGE